ncbi:hypothetical protein CKO_03815 [Citrobacter koseri ATCC BAA-895]|uniref:Uncharacterized protein n=1 Tax=Citrobacter koseri (strain ATCC BAA-895 / CDC 4225-83 / SGSC4696) TaxID=290338 RepID=A8AN28_CITK8|nr:hypothetical protein CKO_03815 [Citrobacter koseri ATCC BAA-895]
MWFFVTHRGEQCHDSIRAVAVVEKQNKEPPLKAMAQSG